VIGTPAAASRACSARTSRTWIRADLTRLALQAGLVLTARGGTLRPSAAPVGSYTHSPWPGAKTQSGLCPRTAGAASLSGEGRTSRPKPLP
jgi:hypothetical protein